MLGPFHEGLGAVECDLLEIGEGQGADVVEILEAAGYERTAIKKEYNGLERLVAAFRPGC